MDIDEIFQEMDINEVIQEFEELAEYWIAKSHDLSRKYKQIAEWLKERRDIPYNNESCLSIYKDGYREGYKDGYVKKVIEDGYRKAKE